MTELALKGLTKSYGTQEVTAVDGISLTVKSGSMMAILGPSGCGKTTVMKLVAGLVEPSAGEITFDGGSVLSQKPEQRGAVMVFQNHLLFPHLDVSQNVGFGLRMRGLARRDIDARVAEMLNLVQLPDMGGRRPADLSGGQQQRVALARALVVRPRVLLLDEPLSNLDAHLRVEMRELIKSLQRETGVTTLFVTHDQTEAAIVADEIALLLAGRLAQKGSAETLFERPESLEVAQFFGVRNIIAGRVENGMFTSALAPLRLGGQHRDRPAILALRPEAVLLGPADENTLDGVLVDRAYLGGQTQLRVRIGSVTLDVLVSATQAANLVVGATMSVHIPASALWILPADG
jgi:ABC-type Fe3+/spermidine/putrescine transport system ATPase subunit